jgi:hypothetical protein
LLEEIQEKHRKVRLGPVAVIAGILLMLFALGGEWPIWAFLLTVLIASAAIFAALYRDKLTKTVVILYEFETDVEAAFKRFSEWAEAVSHSAKAWHVAASAQVYDRKYHAGASQLVRRSPTALQPMSPPFIRTNIPVFSLGVGRQTLFFLPDRLLVYDGSAVGGVTYETLDCTVTRQQFIEDTGVPADATVIGYTWRYVNKNGGPDRRFNNNPQLPICLYDELYLRTVSGLNEIVQLSRSGVAEGFVEAVRHLGAIVPRS